MSWKTLVVSGAVAAICATVLVLLTDIEVGVVRWISCGPLHAGDERSSELCR